MLDLTRSRKELLAENAFLRHQLRVAVRKVKRPKLRTADRIVLVGLAALFASWRNALLLVQPETLLALASRPVSLVLGSRQQAEEPTEAEAGGEDHRAHQTHGHGQSNVGCQAHSR